MYCIGISFKQAPVEIREKIAFSVDEQKAFLKDNMIILSTCNRVEVYFTDYSINRISKDICEFKGFDYNTFKSFVNIYVEDGALFHLYRVAVGLESKILGEDEILGQVKDAYYFAHNNVSLNYELNTIFKGAITAAKKIKTETLISKSAVSIGTLTAAFLHKKGVKKVMIIGIGGKIGTIVAKNLLSYKDISIIATSRGHGADIVNIADAEYISFCERYKHMNGCDAIISVTTSPHYTITAEKVKLHNIKDKIFIDLAVPRDIDEDISHNSLYNIDYFDAMSKSNSEVKIRAVDNALSIIEKMIDDVKKELFFHNIDVESLNKMPFDKMIYKLRDNMTSREFEKLINILKE